MDDNRRTNSDNAPFIVRVKKNYRNSAEFFAAQVRRRDYKEVKEGVIPKFFELTPEMQEYYKSLIATSRGVNAKTLATTILLTARQIGQLKRRLREKENHIVRLP